MVELHITAGRVGENPEHNVVVAVRQTLRESQHDRLRAVHAAAADEVQHLHERSAPAVSRTVSARLITLHSLA